MTPPWPKLWLAAAAGGLAVVALGEAGALVVVFSGLFDASADTPHLAPVAWGTHTAMVNYVRAAAPVTGPRLFSREAVARGFRSYDQHCASCHGGPGVNRAPWASAMTPTPPYLLDAARRWSTGQLFFVVDHGVKMTAMPAWGEVLPRRDIWDLVAFLQAMPNMPPTDYARLRQAARVLPPPAPPPVPPSALFRP
jgi:mono/diheme cytochrome c family protein